MTTDNTNTVPVLELLRAVALIIIVVPLLAYINLFGCDEIDLEDE